jgi:hypothetical protein
MTSIPPIANNAIKTVISGQIDAGGLGTSANPGIFGAFRAGALGIFGAGGGVN